MHTMLAIGLVGKERLRRADVPCVLVSCTCLRLFLRRLSLLMESVVSRLSV